MRNSSQSSIGLITILALGYSTLEAGAFVAPTGSAAAVKVQNGGLHMTPPTAMRPLFSTRTVRRMRQQEMPNMQSPAASNNKHRQSSSTHLAAATEATAQDDKIFGFGNGKKRLAACMAFLLGWSDVTLFLKFRSFPTMLTGCTMWLVNGLVDGRWMDAGYFGSLILSYVVGLAIFRKTDLSLKQRTMPVCAGLVTLLFLASQMASNASSGGRFIPMSLMAMGYGIINSVGQEVTGGLTFVVTGHITKLTHQVVDRFLSRTPRPMDAKTVLQNVSVTLGFAAGAVWAFVLKKKQIKLFSMILGSEIAILGVLHGLLFMWQDMEALGGAWWLRKDKNFCEVDDDGELCVDAADP